MKSLDQVAVSATTDPRKAFEQYSKSVANLESAANDARKCCQDVKEQGKAYFAQWEKQFAEVKNPDIRNLADGAQGQAAGKPSTASSKSLNRSRRSSIPGCPT